MHGKIIFDACRNADDRLQINDLDEYFDRVPIAKAVDVARSALSRGRRTRPPIKTAAHRRNELRFIDGEFFPVGEATAPTRGIIALYIHDKNENDTATL